MPRVAKLIEGEALAAGFLVERMAGGRALAPVLAAAAPAPRRALAAPALDPHVQVVVVVGQRHDHAGRSGEAGIRADEDRRRTGGQEAVDQVLGEPGSISEASRGARSRPSARG